MLSAIGNHHPLFTTKRALKAEPPSLPTDTWRPEPSTMSFGLKAFGVGALALTALTGAAATAQAQEQTQTEARPVHRHSAPLSGEQRTRLADLAEERATDNATAREVRANYRHQVDRLQKDANAYMDLSETLEAEGQRLQNLADNPGPNVTVQRDQSGMTVTERVNGVTTELRSYGDSWVVEVNNGRRTQTLEDTGAARTVTDGMFTRTLHLTDSILHKAGDFESQQVTRSWQDSVTVNGTRITRNLERLVPDAHGRARLNQTEVFEEPQAAGFLEGPAPTLVYKQNSTRKNLFTDEVTQSSQEVEIRNDGSTRTGRGVEPGRPANPTTLEM